MLECIVTLVVGIACIVIGILNTRGNISMLHSYHTKRVSEEDRIPFGRLVGIGMIAIGVAVTVGAGLVTVGEKTESAVLTVVGYSVMAAGFVFGIGISFYAMIKYNKGIF